MFHIDGAAFCVEHTQIEPYEGHLSAIAATKRAEQRLQRDLSDLNFPRSFEIMIPASWSGGLTKIKSQHAFVDEVAALIRAMRVEIESAVCRDESDYLTLGLVRGHEISVGWSPLSDDGWANGPYIGLLVDGETEGRSERLRRSFCEKVPKLLRFAESVRGEAILLLENRDMSLSNWNSIAEVVLSNLQLTDGVDHVIHINTTNSVWMLFPITAFGRPVHQLANGLRKIFRYPESELRTIL